MAKTRRAVGTTAITVTVTGEKRRQQLSPTLCLGVLSKMNGQIKVFMFFFHQQSVLDWIYLYMHLKTFCRH